MTEAQMLNEKDMSVEQLVLGNMWFPNSTNGSSAELTE